MNDNIKHKSSELIEYFISELGKYNDILLIDANDSFTHNLVQAFLSLGSSVRVVNTHNQSVNDLNSFDFDYIVLSPGPKRPFDAGIMKDVIRYYYKKKPILGVCLGMQAINEVFNGSTVKAKEILHGKMSIINHSGTGIFSAIPSPTSVARYHSLMINGLDKRFKIQSQINDVIMAFHEPNIIAAVQFHPESFLTAHGMQMLTNFLERIF
jgi:anthranilate synthase component II